MNMRRLVVLVFISFFLSSAVSCITFDCQKKSLDPFTNLRTNGIVTIKGTDNTHVKFKFEDDGSFTIVDTDYFSLIPFIGMHVSSRNKNWISTVSSKKMTFSMTFPVVKWRGFVMDYTEANLPMGYTVDISRGGYFKITGKFSLAGASVYISTAIGIGTKNGAVRISLLSIFHGSTLPTEAQVDANYHTFASYSY